MQIRPAKAFFSPTGGSRELLLLLLCFGACTYTLGAPLSSLSSFFFPSMFGYWPSILTIFVVNSLRHMSAHLPGNVYQNISPINKMGSLFIEK